ncbi:hypothetical protein WYI_13967 [Ochrobactrum sp. CDB2]|nr:hypothetical protein WYI_13967 [Ochrobactrum sp. CDB2]
MMTDEASYYSTEAGQFIANAHRYLSAAKFLTQRGNWRYNHKVPALHLLGHGIELFLKYPLIRAGSTQRDVSKTYGHNLEALWDAEGNKICRNYVLEISQTVWETAKNSGDWPDEFDGDPRESLVSGLHSLSYLHGRESSHALRYTIPEPLLAPRPRFLIETFSDLAERTCMNPAYLDD